MKLWTRGWLTGSIRFDLTPAQRSVFLDLLALARESRNPPWIQANENMAYPHEWLANQLNIPLSLLEETLRLCVEHGRITENHNGIKILKFEMYQGEDYKKATETHKGSSLKHDQIDDPNFGKIASIYEENIGILTPIIGQELQTIADQYPTEWFEKAILIACEANVRKLNYIRAILERWKVEGKDNKKPNEKPRTW